MFVRQLKSSPKPAGVCAAYMTAPLPSATLCVWLEALAATTHPAMPHHMTVPCCDAARIRALRYPTKCFMTATCSSVSGFSMLTSQPSKP